MSLCFKSNSNSQIMENGITLPEKQKKYYLQNNGTPLTTWKGSLTVEAAVVIPLVSICLITIIFMFRALQVQTDMQEAVCAAGRKSAVETSASSSKLIPLAAAEVHFRKEIKNSAAVDEYVCGGTSGVSLLGSEVDGNYLELKASCRLRFPFAVLGLGDIHILAGCRTRIWNGHTEGEEEDPVVYYTPSGRVYHLTCGCPSLKLTTRPVRFEEVDGLRNKDGHKYYPCKECAPKAEKETYVFITDYGTVYHTRLGCSKLKRTVIRTTLSKVKGRGKCKLCR